MEDNAVYAAFYRVCAQSLLRCKMRTSGLVHFGTPVGTVPLLALLSLTDTPRVTLQ